MKRSKCPDFVCLEYDAEKCERYKACDGCYYHYACGVCLRKETVVEGQLLSCDLINLPESCRFCSTRNSPTFSPDDCNSCTSSRPKK